MDRKSIGMVAGNEDVLIEILLRVPAKSLVKFKIVSKHWLSLIADPKFCSNHTLMNPTSPVLGMYFCCERNFWPKQVNSFSLHQATQRFPTLAFLEKAVPNSTPVILHACKGLFLCSLGRKIKKYAVCNLATRRFTLLPDYAHGLSSRSCNSACLVFEPSKSFHYKVVLVSRMVRVQRDYPWTVRDFYAIEIYSSRMGSWECKYIEAQHTYHLIYKVVFNGAIHWMTNRLSHVRFELDAEKLITNPVSSKLEFVGERDVCYFGECDGLLCFAYNTHRMCNGFIEMLAMNKNYIGWTLLYRIDINTIKDDFPQCFPTPDAMFFMVRVVKEEEGDKNGDNFAVLFATCGKIISYNLKSNKSKEVCILPNFSPCQDEIQHTYTSSFMATLCPVLPCPGTFDTSLSITSSSFLANSNI